MRSLRYDVPFLLRLFGCFEAAWPSYRFRWVEIAFGRALCLEYAVYHESATLRIGLLFVTFYIKAPMLITQRPGTEDWNASYGFSLFGRGVHWNWRTRCKITAFPWDWQHVRRTILNPDGSPWRDEPKGPGQWLCDEDIPAPLKEQHRYNYLRQNGEVQTCITTVYGEEREWRWRGLARFTWAPRRVSRSIHVTFSEEMGEGRGSWKGGVLGTGFEWREGERMQHALRRMERERYFGR